MRAATLIAGALLLVASAPPVAAKERRESKAPRSAKEARASNAPRSAKERRESNASRWAKARSGDRCKAGPRRAALC
ncbi:MAG: hypothetical protein M3320_06270, partial [Actinomycetota bacterium]|nr:hypothetical protein [Actinomycetota bacterium]